MYRTGLNLFWYGKLCKFPGMMSNLSLHVLVKAYTAGIVEIMAYTDWLYRESKPVIMNYHITEHMFQLISVSIIEHSDHPLQIESVTVSIHIVLTCNRSTNCQCSHALSLSLYTYSQVT